MRLNLDRVIVVGAAGSGKTTLARELARILTQPHVEMDGLFWLPNWQVRPRDQFGSMVEAATAGDLWVVDGNYGNIRETTSYWTRATAVIWLNYRLLTSFRRALLRSLRCSIVGEPRFAGSRESLSRAFLSRNSILLWILTSHAERARQFSSLRAAGKYPQLEWIEFRKPRQAEDFLNALRSPAAGSVDASAKRE